jgi:isoleucyl-tRNA synthetase
VIDNLTNWYIRFNRKRLKTQAGAGTEDTKDALNTLLLVLFTAIRALAPFTPFLTEHIYGLMKPFLVDLLADVKDSRSIHFLPFPTVQDSLFDAATERKVAAMQKVISLGRTARERRNIPTRTPLLEVVVVADEEHLSDVKELESYVKEELNVREVVLSTDAAKYNIVLKALVDWPTLGKKLKKNVQAVKKALPDLTQDQLKAYLEDGKMTVAGGIELEKDDLTIIRAIGDSPAATSGSAEGPQLEPAFSNDVIVLLDCAPHPELLNDGLARDIISRVQQMRKKAGLQVTDDVHMQYEVVSNPDGTEIDELIRTRQDVFVGALRGPLEPLANGAKGDEALIAEDTEVGGLVLKLRLAKI